MVIPFTKVFVFLSALCGALTAQAPCDDGVWGGKVNLTPTFNSRHAALIPFGPQRGNVLVWGPHREVGDFWEMDWKIADIANLCTCVSGTLITARIPDNEGNPECGGHSWDPSGDLLIVGGMEDHGPPVAKGSKLTFKFDTTLLDWVPMGNMKYGRWYPTVVQLSNGDHLALGGRDQTGALQDNYEQFLFQAGTWNLDTWGESTEFEGPPGGAPSCQGLDVYPRIHMVPVGSNGMIFVSGATGSSVGIDHLSRTTPYLESDWSTYNNAAVDWRKNGGSVLLPMDLRSFPTNLEVKVLTIAGDTKTNCNSSSVTSSSVEVIDLSATTPTWTAAPSLSTARAKHNSVLLPDDSILVVGGEPDPPSGSPPTIYNAELFVNGAWKTIGVPDSWRGDHSVALLLPDATVLTAGGQGYRAWDFQIYEPPYLHCGDPRPIIAAVSSSIWFYGGDNNLSYTLAQGTVDRAVLMRPGSVTHGFDTDQRSLILEASFNSGSATLTAPPDATYAPPGHYMLFLISDQGVPSEAAWVLLQ